MSEIDSDNFVECCLRDNRLNLNAAYEVNVSNKAFQYCVVYEDYFRE